MKIKCKQCKIYIRGICLKFQRRRSSGKKRDCPYADPKPAKTKSYAPYSKYVSKADKRKERQRIQYEKDRRNKLREIAEQRKLAEVALSPIQAPKDTITIKKPNLLRRIFRNKCP